jgi:putative phosphoesterase
MKVAVLADIHSNLHALHRVADDIAAWDPEAVVVAGDVINRGPRPAECLQFVLDRQREAHWRLVRGNHEDYVLIQASPAAPRSGPAFEVFRNSYWTYLRLQRQTAELEAMPLQASLAGPDGREFRVVHGSMRGNRDGIFPDTPDRLLKDQMAPAPAVLCAGHTHRPVIRSLDGSLVVNVGSVGAPFDGDPRAAYARLTWRKGAWQAEIVRLDYDRARTDREFFDLGYLSGAGPLATIILVELRIARSLLHLWVQHYERSVLAGEMTMEQSVVECIERFSGYDPAVMGPLP